MHNFAVENILNFTLISILEPIILILIVILAYKVRQLHKDLRIILKDRKLILDRISLAERLEKDRDLIDTYAIEFLRWLPVEFETLRRREFIGEEYHRRASILKFALVMADLYYSLLGPEEVWSEKVKPYSDRIKEI